MNQRTHFWKTFVARNKNYVVVISNKTNKSEDFPLSPDLYSSSFKDIGVDNKATIILHEITDAMLYDEGGEDEMDEMEEEEIEEN